MFTFPQLVYSYFVQLSCLYILWFFTSFSMMLLMNLFSSLSLSTLELILFSFFSGEDVLFVVTMFPRNRTFFKLLPSRLLNSLPACFPPLNSPLFPFFHSLSNALCVFWMHLVTISRVQPNLFSNISISLTGWNILPKFACFALCSVISLHY